MFKPFLFLFATAMLPTFAFAQVNSNGERSPTNIQSQERRLPAFFENATNGIIKRTSDGLCLEPSHPSYETSTPIAAHKTIRDCILAGGRRDVRSDTQTRPGQPEQQSPDSQSILNMDPRAATEMRDDAADPTVQRNTQMPNDVILESFREMVITDTNGSPLSLKDVTPEQLLEYQDLGLIPANFDVDTIIKLLQEENTTKNAQQPSFSRSGPKEIELPETPSYSQKDAGLFRSPEAYIGRSAQEFHP